MRCPLKSSDGPGFPVPLAQGKEEGALPKLVRGHALTNSCSHVTCMCDNIPKTWAVSAVRTQR